MRAVLKGLPGLDRKMARLFAGAERKTMSKVARVAARGLEFVATQSPQSTGDFASQWVLSVGEPFLGGMSGGVGAERESYSQGDKRAIRIAVGRAAPIVKIIASSKLGSSIYMTNNSYHGEDSYSWKIEGGEVHFRKANFMLGDPSNLVAQTVSFMKRRLK